MKPWRIASNSVVFLRGLKGLCSDGKHAHTPCEGVDTKLSENYTQMFVVMVHASHLQCSKQFVPSPLSASPALPAAMSTMRDEVAAKADAALRASSTGAPPAVPPAGLRSASPVPSSRGADPSPAPPSPPLEGGSGGEGGTEASGSTTAASYVLVGMPALPDAGLGQLLAGINL